MSEQKVFLEPGKVIRPVIDHEEVKLLAERLYGISVLELEELNGYDDKNYKIIEDPNVKNPLIIDPSPHGYVLKIMNSMDSKNLEVVEAQNEMMKFLSSRSVTCPTPVRNVFGQLHSSEALCGRAHVVRLLRYVPGALLTDAPASDALWYRLGQFAANLVNKLEHFNHSGVMASEHIWMLSKVPELEKFKYVIKDAEQLDLVEEVIEEFKYAVVPQMDELEQGVIHGDINDMNVLVALKEGRPLNAQVLKVCKQILNGITLSESEYRIAGLLDFGDIQRSCVVFELAVSMTYAALAGGARAGGPLLAGWSAARRLPAREYRLLKTLISARLVQSLILGAYTREQDPTNKYVSTTEKANGWELLKTIRKSKPDPDNDCTNWKAIADEYLTRS